MDARVSDVRWTSRGRQLGVLSADAGVCALALVASLYSRFDFGPVPKDYLLVFARSLPILVATRVLFIALAGLHRWSFRMSGLHEAVRLAVVNLLGTVVLITVFFFTQSQHLPRSVLALEFFFTTALMGSYRFLPRLAQRYYAEHFAARNKDARRTLIVGAGGAGDLLLRDLERSEHHEYRVVGFVDDDDAKIGTRVGGKPVIGRLSQLPELVEKYAISQVLIAIPRLPGARVREMLSACSRKKVTFKIIPASFTFMDERITAAMLHDLSPEDLLPREPVAFDTAEVRKHVHNRCVLVTGAAGSIGNEIARQISQHRPSRLVLVDMNENGLYFLFRRLRESCPELDVRAEIADIRDPDKLLMLGERHRPYCVFHAAAHKHVPLMEDAPEEAVKNNIFGTMNVARMADACGVETFVLISTDKAVRPTSVMGATKRVAEFIVRDLARRSSTRFTAVRFGNVLGSAGSVVPLFKEQIERGGPVTVTDPDCTRYFMTIPEAVGLVLIAGLGHCGELCVLDMGEPIKIADLARNMITMAGHVPDGDVKIEYTGLRPGEKLFEELLTEEEEESHEARNKILVAVSPPPPTNLRDHLDQLRKAAFAAERDTILSVLRALVPSFNSGPGVRNAAGVVSPQRRGALRVLAGKKN